MTTFSTEWMMTPIQVLRKRQLGSARRKTPRMTFALESPIGMVARAQIPRICQRVY
jgi:hypothetical protein